MRVRAVRGACAFVALACMAGPLLAQTSLDAGRQRELRRLLHRECGACHGALLKGGLGPSLLPEALADRTAENLALVILDGRPDAAMPPWRPFMTEAEARWLAMSLKEGVTP